MDLVYHHTNTDGLIGIIGYAALWATDIHFLNDYEEYVAGIEKIFHVCEENKIKEGDNRLVIPLNNFYSIIPEFIKKNTEGRSTFITSFTKKRDNLRQWMSYGKPNSSYSIGFDPEELKNIRLDKDNHRSAELAYAFTEVDYEFDSIVDRALSRDFLRSALSVRNVDVAGYASKLVNKLMFGCCSIKRKEFEDEDESRMVIQTRKMGETFSGTKFRNLGGAVTPYIEVPLPLHAIREIIIGPSINRELAEKGLRKMLGHKKINCEVSHSRCTLRQY